MIDQDNSWGFFFVFFCFYIIHIQFYLNDGVGASIPITNVSNPVYTCCAPHEGSVASLYIHSTITENIAITWVKYCTARLSITKHMDFHVFSL